MFSILYMAFIDIISIHLLEDLFVIYDLNKPKVSEVQCEL